MKVAAARRNAGAALLLLLVALAPRAVDAAGFDKYRNAQIYELGGLLFYLTHENQTARHLGLSYITGISDLLVRFCPGIKGMRGSFLVDRIVYAGRLYIKDGENRIASGEKIGDPGLAMNSSQFVSSVILKLVDENRAAAAGRCTIPAFVGDWRFKRAL